MCEITVMLTAAGTSFHFSAAHGQLKMDVVICIQASSLAVELYNTLILYATAVSHALKEGSPNPFSGRVVVAQARNITINGKN